MPKGPNRRTSVAALDHHHFDSLRWNFVTLRDDDIVIATSYKAGTTWMQGIVANLIFSGRELPASLFDLSPWVDMRVSRLRHGQSPGGLTTAQPYAAKARGAVVMLTK
jgi:hypothetical protein